MVRGELPLFLGCLDAMLFPANWETFGIVNSCVCLTRGGDGPCVSVPLALGCSKVRPGYPTSCAPFLSVPVYHPQPPPPLRSPALLSVEAMAAGVPVVHFGEGGLKVRTVCNLWLTEPFNVGVGSRSCTARTTWQARLFIVWGW